MKQECYVFRATTPAEWKTLRSFASQYCLHTTLDEMRVQIEVSRYFYVYCKLDRIGPTVTWRGWGIGGTFDNCVMKAQRYTRGEITVIDMAVVNKAKELFT